MHLDNPSAINSDDSQGAGQYIDLVGVEFGGDVTFNWWGHFENFHSFSRVFDFGDTANDDNAVLCNEASTAQLRVALKEGSTVLADVYASTLSAYVDTHIVVRLSTITGLADVFINGALSQSLSMTAALPTLTRENHWMGRSNWGHDEYFDGWMQAFSVYKRVLSASDVDSLYQKGLNNPCYVVTGLNILHCRL